MHRTADQAWGVSWAGPDTGGIETPVPSAALYRAAIPQVTSHYSVLKSDATCSDTDRISRSTAGLYECMSTCDGSRSCAAVAFITEPTTTNAPCSFSVSGSTDHSTINGCYSQRAQAVNTHPSYENENGILLFVLVPTDGNPVQWILGTSLSSGHKASAEIQDGLGPSALTWREWVSNAWVSATLSIGAGATAGLCDLCPSWTSTTSTLGGNVSTVYAKQVPTGKSSLTPPWQLSVLLAFLSLRLPDARL